MVYKAMKNLFNLKFLPITFLMIFAQIGFAGDKTIGGAAGDNNLRDKAEDETIYTGPGIDTVTDTFGDNAILIKVYKND
jgi:hypothetical protein